MKILRMKFDPIYKEKYKKWLSSGHQSKVFNRHYRFAYQKSKTRISLYKRLNKNLIMRKLIKIEIQVMILMKCIIEGIVKYTLVKKNTMMIGRIIVYI